MRPEKANNPAALPPMKNFRRSILDAVSVTHVRGLSCKRIIAKVIMVTYCPGLITSSRFKRRKNIYDTIVCSTIHRSGTATW